jgi:hypothetical protein
MEKIISEFRVIETDDGFRIEVKGDKEKITSFMSSFGHHKWGRQGRGRRRSPGRGPFGFHFDPWMWMKAAGFCVMRDVEGEEEEEKETSQE